METEKVPFPIVDNEVLLPLLDEYKSLSLNPSDSSGYLERKLPKGFKIGELVLAKAQWLIDFVSAFPSGEWDSARLFEHEDSFFAQVRRYKRFCKNIMPFANLSGKITFLGYSDNEFTFSYITGYDEDCPESDYIGFPEKYICENDESALKDQILIDARTRITKSVQSLRAKVGEELLCWGCIHSQLEKKGL